jgi:1-acyl-sn-glycerol-3-phosphate acyltransferase
MAGSGMRQGGRVGPAMWFVVFVLKPFLTIFTRRNWQGTENLRQPGGVVIAANHLSWFDPLILSHVLWDNGRPPRFLAKDSLFEVPVVGSILRGAGQIPVVRGTRDASKAVEAAVQGAREGEAVLVYPEGTITKDPNLWPSSAKSGAARIALTSGRPLVPLAHWGAQDIMGPYRKELRLLPRKTIHVLIGPPVNLDDLRELPLNQEILNEATRRLMADITALLERVRGESASHSDAEAV